MKSDSTKYDEVLGMPNTMSPDELKKAYKKAGTKNHPDKGGDPEKLKKVSHAYEIPSDPEKREINDTYGENALKEWVAVVRCMTRLTSSHHFLVEVRGEPT